VSHDVLRFNIRVELTTVRVIVILCLAKGGNTGEGWASKRGTGEKGPDEEGPGEGELDRCIMHRVHTNIYIYISLLIRHNKVICKVSEIRDGIGMELFLRESKQVEIIRWSIKLLN
jgi:hypothetical protein